MFTTPALPVVADAAGDEQALIAQTAKEPAFARWIARNVHAHRVAGLRAVTLSFKRVGQAPAMHRANSSTHWLIWWTSSLPAKPA